MKNTPSTGNECCDPFFHQHIVSVCVCLLFSGILSDKLGVVFLGANFVFFLSFFLSFVFDEQKKCCLAFEIIIFRARKRGKFLWTISLSITFPIVASTIPKTPQTVFGISPPKILKFLHCQLWSWEKMIPDIRERHTHARTHIFSGHLCNLNVCASHQEKRVWSEILQHDGISGVVWKSFCQFENDSPLSDDFESNR